MGWTRFFRRARWDAERAAEIEAHVQMEFDRNLAIGMAPADARAAAHRKFGSPTSTREEIYRMNTLALVENFARDVAYGLRTLSKSPGFTAVAILSLALGIGANTAIYGLVDLLIVRPLPVARPQELARFTLTPGDPADVYEHIADGAAVFSGTFAHGGVYNFNLQLDKREERVQLERATSDYFSVLGVTPLLGRTFTGGEPAVVISYEFWERRFGLDPGVLGKTFPMGKSVFTIVGVGPRGFNGISVDRFGDIWAPLTDRPEHIVGRLKPGISLSQASAALSVRFEKRVTLLPGATGISNIRQRYQGPLLVLLAIVGLVLLIACANIANLLLARATARRREMAVRLAIGASRGRLILQLVTESLLLSFAGAAAGLVFAFWAGQTLVRMVLATSNDSDIAYHLDLRVLLFTAGIAALTGILFGLGPAVRATRVDLTPALKNEPAAARTRLPLAKILVMSQVAVSLTLVLGAALFVTTVRNLVSQDFGFRADSLLVAPFQFEERAPAAFGDLLNRVRAMPGVQSATLSQYPALTGQPRSEAVYAEAGDAPPVAAFAQHVAPNYFETMRIPVTLGRTFTARDEASAAKVVILNETLARKLFGDRPAIGRRVGWKSETRTGIEVVSVVKDVRQSNNLREAAPASIYWPTLQPQTSPSARPIEGAVLSIRAQDNPASLIEPLRTLFRESRARAGNMRTQQAIIEAGSRQERLLAQVSAVLGGIGLLLAAAGLYGMMAYTVSRRTSEMGIRMALGARPGDVVRMVLRESSVLVLGGVAAGMVGAFAAARLVAGFLFGVAPTDPGIVAAAASILMMVGLLAAWLPALRAARVAPINALRHD